MSKIGFIGVGLMGHGMAARLMRAGHNLTVIAHRNRAPIDDLVAKGAREAASLADIAAGQDAIFLCVTGTPQVESILAAIGPSLAANQIVVDTGTSIPDSTTRLAADLAVRGIGWADAPVGGGVQNAANGELVSMVGATAADFARVKTWLEATSKAVHHMGGPGTGHRAKLLNNMVSVGQAALVLQAYTIARKSGLDWQKLFEIMMAGIARSGSLERIMVPALRGDFDGYVFSASNAGKDLGYAADFTDASGEPSGVPAALRDYFLDAAMQHGGGTLISQLLKGG